MENVVSLAVSVVALVVSWRAYRLSRRAFERDRSDLRLGLEYNPKTGLGAAFRVILVNHGRRQVTVKDVRLRLKSGKIRSYANLSSRNANLLVKLPVALEETESCDFIFLLYNGQGLVHTPLEIKRVEAFDTLGDQYSYPTGGLKSQIDFIKLRWQIARHWRVQKKGLRSNDQ